MYHCQQSSLANAFSELTLWIVVAAASANRAALTVVVRIFYSVDRDSSGKITLRKLRRSNLIDAFNCVDEEEDINKVRVLFSPGLRRRCST